MNSVHSIPDQSCFSIKMPYIPDNTKSGIGFIVDKSYNHNSNIKVLQDVVLSVIFNNRNARYAVYSEYERCTFWIKKYLYEDFKIPKENIKFIPKYEVPTDEDESCPYFHGSLSLREYKELIATFPLNSLYVFTDNPKSDTIRELVKSSHMHHFKIFTIDCEGCFLDYDNPHNSTNEYYFTQGGYINEPVKTPKELIFRSKPSNRGNY